MVQKETLSRNRAYTTVKSACTFLEFKNIDENKCSVWVRELLQLSKIKFSEDIPSYIVSCVGTDVSKLKNEIRKIILYYDEATNDFLTQRDCNLLFSISNDVNYFTLVENFYHKRVNEVFKEFKKVDDYSFVKVLHLLISQANRLYNIAIYKVNGMSVDDISSLININKYILKTKLFTALSFYSKIKLVQLIDLFNKADLELRTTKFPKRQVMEFYLMKAMKL